MTNPDDERVSVAMYDKAALSIIISAAQLIASNDRDGAALLLTEADVPSRSLADAALSVFSGVMAGDHAAERFAELRADVHRIAAKVGASDGRVILSLETIAAAQGITEDKPDRAQAILDGSEFSAVTIANAAVTFCGQAIASWMGERAPQFFSVLRREYGVHEGAA